MNGLDRTSPRNVYMVRGGPGRNVPNSGFIVGKSGVISKYHDDIEAALPVAKTIWQPAGWRRD